MENVTINRAYLETLSFTDLLKLADDYSIDVPEDFERGFLIGEILDVSDKSDEEEESDLILSDDDDFVLETEDLPRAYNSTEVQIMLRNPAWAFVYWNISESDQISLSNAFVSELRIRVNCFTEKDQLKPDEYFEFKISKFDNGQYVLLPAGKKYFRVDLLFNVDGIIDILASSNVLEMPKGSVRLQDMRPGRNENLSPIMKLSGMEELLIQHYKNHRESFS